MSRLPWVAAIALSLIVAPIVATENTKCVSDGWMADLLGEVSGSEIMEIVTDLQSFGTRDFHTQSAVESAEYIKCALQDLGLDTHLQEFYVDAVATVNVVAVLHPEAAAEGVYVVGAHYDSENSMVTNQSEAENITAPGADDNASGIGVMLEIARALSHSDREFSTVKFVAFGAEERGYDYSGGIKGSAEFVAAEADAGTVCKGAFVLDMVGYRASEENRATLIYNGASEDLADSISSSASEFDLDIAIRKELTDSIVYSDHSAFWEQGYPSTLVTEELNLSTHFPINPYYHSSEDTADKLSDDQMAAVAKALLGALLNLTYQGEDSYTPPSYSVVVAGVVVTAIIIASLMLLRRWKGGSKDV